MKKIGEIISNHNFTLFYRITSIIILATISVGLFATYNEIFYHFGKVGRDILWLCFFYIIAFLLIVQFLAVWLLGRVKKISKLCCSIFILNIATFILSFMIFGILLAMEYVLTGKLDNLFEAIPGYVEMTVFWPAGTIWGPHSWIYAVIFVILASAISTCLQYFFLRKNTASKKLLFTSLLISSLICYSVITVFFYFNY